MTKIRLKLRQFLGSRKKPSRKPAQIYRPDPNFVPGSPPLNEADFLKPVLIVHFWANWNGMDIPIDKELSAVQPWYEGKIAFRSCDVEQAENREFCTGIATVPLKFPYPSSLRRAGV